MIHNSKKTKKVLIDVHQERVAQDVKWGDQSQHPDVLWNTILTEEMGEAANAVLEHDLEGLREELIQIAAVAVAWAEALDVRSK